MACEDVITLTDLENSKKHNTFEAEVITGKAGGLVGGANIDTATNAVTSQKQKTLPKILNDLESDIVAIEADAEVRITTAIASAGYQIVGDFADVTKVQITSANQVYTSQSVTNLEDAVWRYTGALPYTPTGSDPTQSPEAGKWQAVAIGELKAIARSLNEPDANVGYSTAGLIVKKIVYDAPAQVIYSAPADAIGQTISSVVGSTLNTTEPASYQLKPVSTENEYITPDIVGAVGDGIANDYVALQFCFSNFKNILIPKGKVYRTDTQINCSNDDVTLTISGKILGDFGAQEQSLLVFSKTPPAIGSASFVEPVDTIDNLTIIFDGGELDWGVNGTSFVYDYGDVKDYWVYNALYIDRGVNFKISGNGKISNALIGSLQCRRPKSFTVDSNLICDGNVWDNSASFTSSPNPAGFGTGEDSEEWNNGHVKGLRLLNAPSYGANTFNTIGVEFEDCKAIKCDKGFSAEQVFDKTINGATKFRACEALDLTGVSSDPATDRAGTGFVLEAGGSSLDADCKAIRCDVGARVIQARDVRLDCTIDGTTNDGVRISQNGTVSPEVTLGSSFKALNTGADGVNARGVNILTVEDGAQIQNNTGYAIYPSNSGGANYNQGSGILNIGRMLSKDNLGLRTNDMEHVVVDNPVMLVDNTKGLDIRATANAKVVGAYVFDNGSGLLSTSGFAIVFDATVTNSYYWGLSTDANTRIANSAANKYGMGQEGDSDSAVVDLTTIVNDVNDLRDKLRRAGVINQ